MWKGITGGIAIVAAFVLAGRMLGLSVTRSSSWQPLTSPGPLSKAHAFIGNNCAACHTSVAGVTRAKCVACHANDTDLVRLQPTAFHATISQCAPCHYEHAGGLRPINMDHVALAQIGLQMLAHGNKEQQQNRARLLSWVSLGGGIASNPALTSKERLLNCAACHQVQDVHSGSFGQNCALCHATRSWFIAGYVHPSSSSRQCTECHRASPCHYMGEMSWMMMKRMAGHNAPVEQCYRCHNITSWYDFRLRNDDR
jgi:hypothetical protein